MRGVVLIDALLGRDRTLACVLPMTADSQPPALLSDVLPWPASDFWRPCVEPSPNRVLRSAPLSAPCCDLLARIARSSKPAFCTYQVHTLSSRHVLGAERPCCGTTIQRLLLQVYNVAFFIQLVEKHMPSGPLDSVILPRDQLRINCATSVYIRVALFGRVQMLICYKPNEQCRGFCPGPCWRAPLGGGTDADQRRSLSYIVCQGCEVPGRH